MSRKRIRAHANPLSEADFDYPQSPEKFDWHAHYPAFFPDPADASSSSSDENKAEVTIADVGCGFGGLMVGLAPLFPNKLIMGLEIRGPVVNIVHERILKLRADNAPQDSEQKDKRGNPYENISVVRTNIMKYAPNYFRKGQLEKMFVLFPDPHFKKSNFRRRVINPNFLAIYAYIIREGGLLYTITDVKDLHDWMVKHLTEHPLFERIPDEELANDPCVEVMTNKTEEGQKVARLSGNKYPAVFRRIAP